MLPPLRCRTSRLLSPPPPWGDRKVDDAEAAHSHLATLIRVNEGGKGGERERERRLPLLQNKSMRERNLDEHTDPSIPRRGIGTVDIASWSWRTTCTVCRSRAPTCCTHSRLGIPQRRTLVLLPSGNEHSTLHRGMAWSWTASSFPSFFRPFFLQSSNNILTKTPRAIFKREGGDPSVRLPCWAQNQALQCGWKWKHLNVEKS